MKLRSLNDADIPRLTEICQRGMEFDLFNAEVVREKTTGAKDFQPELGLASERDGQIVAFAQGAMGQLEKNADIGYVRLMVVDRAYRRQGVASQLLAELETRLAARGARTIQVFDCPHNYYSPGVDFRYTEAYCFLQKQKYEMYRENHNLVCDLDVNSWPSLDADAAAYEAEGIIVRRADPGDLPAINMFLDEHWPAWRFEVHGALENTPPSLYLAFMEGRVVAFSGYQGNNKGLSWFGPMGTSPVLRGKGIGAILLRLCLRDLARQGWPTAVIPWVGPVPFYSRYCGARIDRCYWAYRKQL